MWFNLVTFNNIWYSCDYVIIKNTLLRRSDRYTTSYHTEKIWKQIFTRAPSQTIPIRIFSLWFPCKDSGHTFSLLWWLMTHIGVISQLKRYNAIVWGNCCTIDMDIIRITGGRVGSKHIVYNTFAIVLIARIRTSNGWPIANLQPNTLAEFYKLSAEVVDYLVNITRSCSFGSMSCRPISLSTIWLPGI